MRFHARLVMMIALLAGLWSAPAAAQAQCGTAEAIGFPLDPAAFRIVQDYAAQSARWQGRFHTGEDWSGPGALGQPVRAIADGRVVVSGPGLWGLDGGVIVIEHTFPDASVAYSMYGHISDQGGTAFPPALSCVRGGEVIATIGDARPAAHLHFEIRTSENLTAGAGYTWQPPGALGFARPERFIRGWQARLHPAARWQADLADETGPAADPVVLDDGGMLALDTAGRTPRVLRLSADGRVLWRILLDSAPAGLLPLNGSAAVLYAGGEAQQITAEGTLGERWALPAPLAAPPLDSGRNLLLYTPDDRLIAYDTTARAVLWEVADIDQPLHALAGSHATAVLTRSPAGRTTLITLSPAGTVLDRALLTQPAALAIDAGGELLAASAGGVWRIDAAGTWTLLPEAAAGGADAALVSSTAGVRYLFDGATLTAYGPDGSGLWQAALAEPIGGDNTLRLIDDVLLLLSSRGDVVLWRAADGARCGGLRLWGGPRTSLWSALGADGVLRVWVGDQVLGLDWRTLTAAC